MLILWQFGHGLRLLHRILRERQYSQACLTLSEVLPDFRSPEDMLTLVQSYSGFIDGLEDLIKAGKNFGENERDLIVLDEHLSIIE